MDNKICNEISTKRTQVFTLEELLEGAKVVIESMDVAALDTNLTDAQIGFSLPQFLSGYLGPLMRYVGERWHEGRLDVANEHMLSSAIKNSLWRQMRMGPWGGSTSRAIAIGTFSPDCHEIGSMMVACSAAMVGWKPILIGTNLQCVP